MEWHINALSNTAHKSLFHCGMVFIGKRYSTIPFFFVTSRWIAVEKHKPNNKYDEKNLLFTFYIDHYADNCRVFAQ